MMAYIYITYYTMIYLITANTIHQLSDIFKIVNSPNFKVVRLLRISMCRYLKLLRFVYICKIILW